MEKGKFIVLEGLDGAGTTTQGYTLEKYLKSQGRKVLFTREPTDGVVGSIIRSALRKRYYFHEPHFIAGLFLADRTEHVKLDILPMLEKGVDVISDRYYHSSAYQVAGGVNLESLMAMHDDLIAPDLTLFLDLDAKVGMSRIEKNRDTNPELYEIREFLARVQGEYYRINKFLADRGEKIVTIDGSMPIGEVTKAVQREVDLLYKK